MAMHKIPTVIRSGAAAAVLGLGLAAFSLPAAGQIRLPFLGGDDPVVEQVPLSAEQNALVDRMEAVFNSIRTIDARFVQTSQGQRSQGRILMSRPNGLRIEYQDPDPYVLIGDGGAIMYHDRLLQQTTFLPVSQTPAAFIMRENLDMRDGLVIIGFERVGPLFQVMMVQEEDPEEGAITLIFERDPLRFIGWRIIDGAGTQVNFTLVEPIFGLQIDDDVFRIIDPTIEPLPPLPPR